MIAWSGDGGQLASTNWDASISVWDGSEHTMSPDERWAAAESRVFGWHLAMAERALTRQQKAAVAFHLDQIRDAEPSDVSALKRRAKLHFRTGHPDEAEKDYVRWLASGEPDDGNAWLSYAQLLLIRNDRERYRSLCARMLDLLEREPYWDLARSTSEVLGLVQPSPSEAGRLLELMNRTLPAESLQVSRDPAAMALAQYRDAKWESALATLERLKPREQLAPLWYEPLRAMTQFRLGHIAEARQDLARSKVRAGQLRARRSDAKGSEFNGEWVSWETLYHEAETLIEPKSK